MQAELLSPEGDTFSTPPTTPAPPIADEIIRPSLSRRSSRPSSIHTEYSKAEWAPGIVLEALSPETNKINGNGSDVPPSCGFQTNVSQSPPPPRPHHRKPMDSPYFLHSHLNKEASLADWLRTGQPDPVTGHLRVASSLHPHSQDHHHHTNDALFDLGSATRAVDSPNDDDGEFGGNLTKQLADTAVGVREMSKQLGRVRVRSNVQSILVITKARDNRLIKLTRELALYLMLKPRKGQDRGLIVYVDHQLRHSKRFDAEGIERDHPELFVPWHGRRSSNSSLSSLSSSSTHGDYRPNDEGQLRYWTSDLCSYCPHLFDFVVTLGGDGTVLFASWLFQRIVPPVIPFALGSLGFLTNFDFADHETVMDSAIDTGIRVNLRMRFTCTVYRSVAVEAGKGRKAVKKGETGEIMMKNVEKGGWEALEGGWSGHTTHELGKVKDKEIMCFTTRPVETFEVLNDLVVDRGPSPFVSLLELFGDEHHMTTVQADGLTVSTPTGSTAYSLSAGGSLVHPEIPALLITPICPHTLSFRPMLLPDSMELRICVPFNSRSTAWASFDGRGRVELKQGDHIKVTASKYPFPTVCADKQSTDWFHAISRTLKWNERERQKSFVVVEEGPAKSKKRNGHRSTTEDKTKHLVKVSAPDPVPSEESLEDEEEDEVSDEDDEEEEDKFDIDDSSPESALEKTPVDHKHKVTAEAKASPPVRRNKSRSQTRPKLHHGGDARSRVTSPHLQPPRTATRQFDFGFNMSPRGSDHSAGSASSPENLAQHGSRDDIHVSRSALLGGKSRIPKDRDLDVELIKTPTTTELRRGRRAHPHAASSSSADFQPRAFAVWGQDESDSNASESESEFQG